jgi:hypothetical protein
MSPSAEGDSGDGGRRPGGSFVHATVRIFSSTRTAVVLIGLVTLASIAGTVLPDTVAHRLVYDRLWFHALLGALGLNVGVCMLSRRRLGAGRVWSFLLHVGILLVLAGATVTFVSAERGSITLHEGEEAHAFARAAQADAQAGLEPLGFVVRLRAFRIVRYPDSHRLLVMRRGAAPLRIRLVPGERVPVPGAGLSLALRSILPEGDGARVQIETSEGARAVVDAAVGNEVPIGETGLTLAVTRYEPAFVLDRATGTVTSNSRAPRNPAVRVALRRGGKAIEERWLFARMPGFGRMGHASGKPPAAKSAVSMQYLHPSVPVLVADMHTPSGVATLRVAAGQGVACPWDRTKMLVYEHRPGSVKEYESDVEVLEGGRVVREHVIRVNAPLVHRGTKFSQQGYDRMHHSWTLLGVSRDSGAWLVNAGFVVMLVGLCGRFYVRPLVRVLKGRAQKEDSADGTS